MEKEEEVAVVPRLAPIRPHVSIAREDGLATWVRYTQADLPSVFGAEGFVVCPGSTLLLA